MGSQGDRFREIRARHGLSQLEMAERLGVSKSYIGLIENGQREAGRDILEKLAALYQVNLNWYLSGTDGAEPIPYDDALNVYVPLIGQEAAAGPGREIADYPELGQIAVPRPLVAGLNPRCLRAVTVRGDSQIGRGIHDRDIAVYDTQSAEPENLSVVSVAGQLVIKYVAIDRLKGTVTLLSANESFPPRLIRRPEADSVHIEGKVVVVMHRI